MKLFPNFTRHHLITHTYCYYYYYSSSVLSMMILIIGFTCPPSIHFKFITKCDSLFYYNVRQLLLQSATTVFVQSATGITKCDNFITKCDRYSITKCARTMHHLFKEIKREQDINSALQHLKRKKVSQEQRLIHNFFSISSVIVKQFRELFVRRENSQYFYMKAFCKGM